MRTFTDRPFSGLVTRTTVPSGNVLDAAVRCRGLNRSPFAVRRPANPRPYHDARTVGDLAARDGVINAFATTADEDGTAGVTPHPGTDNTSASSNGPTAV